MKTLKIGLTVILFLAAIVVQLPHPAKFSNNHQFDDVFVTSAEAQQPLVPPGQLVSTATNSSLTFTTLGPGSILVAAPTSPLRTYVYRAACTITGSTATVAALWDSGTTGTTPTVTLLDYIPCPASAASGGVKDYDPPSRGPLRLRAGSALGISTFIAVNSSQFSVTYAQGR